MTRQHGPPVAHSNRSSSVRSHAPARIGHMRGRPDGQTITTSDGGSQRAERDRPAAKEVMRHTQSTNAGTEPTTSRRKEMTATQLISKRR